jgi:uracil-DNA glycosylase
MELVFPPSKHRRIHNTEDLSIYELSKIDPPYSWESVFRDSKRSLKFISEKLSEIEKNGKSYPQRRDIFNAFHFTPLYKVKVVIFGQDPYHQSCGDKPRSIGLSFSVRKKDKIPVSLQNIYKEIKNDYPSFKYKNGYLKKWAEQGVLLLNKCLTVTPGKAGSHNDLWDSFIDKVISAILKENPHTIFVLWGKKAQKLNSIIRNRGYILEAVHPSGYSARNGFFGCGHFKEINRILESLNEEEIEW